MPPPPDYSLHKHEGVTVVALDTESLLSVVDVNRVSGELMSLLEDGSRRLVLDLRKLKFAGSAALGMLLSLSTELSTRGGKLVLANTQHIDPLLKLTRAVDRFQIAPDTLTAMEMARA
jgi:anti-anti-sigma factor